MAFKLLNARAMVLVARVASQSWTGRYWPLSGLGGMLLACGLLLALLAAPSQSADDSAPSLERGKEAYGEFCAACHNALRKVGPDMVYDMSFFVNAGIPAPALGMLLRHPVRVRPEGSGMPAYTPEELSDADLDSIGLYLASFTPPPAQPPALGSAERGAPLYASHCAACHGKQGEGVGKMLPVAIFANELKQAGAPPYALLGFVMLSARSGDVPKMPTYSEARLSDTDLADIAAYIWDMPMPAPPGS